MNRFGDQLHHTSAVERPRLDNVGALQMLSSFFFFFFFFFFITVEQTRKIPNKVRTTKFTSFASKLLQKMQNCQKNLARYAAYQTKCLELPALLTKPNNVKNRVKQ